MVEAAHARSSPFEHLRRRQEPVNSERSRKRYRNAGYVELQLLTRSGTEGRADARPSVDSSTVLGVMQSGGSSRYLRRDEESRAIPAAPSLSAAATSMAKVEGYPTLSC